MPFLPVHCIYLVPFSFLFFSFFLRFYLFMRDRERGAETQAEGEAGSMQGAQHGTRSQVSRIRPWAEGSAKPLSHPGCPGARFFSCLSSPPRSSSHSKSPQIFPYISCSHSDLILTSCVFSGTYCSFSFKRVRLLIISEVTDSICGATQLMEMSDAGWWVLWYIGNYVLPRWGGAVATELQTINE